MSKHLFINKILDDCSKCVFYIDEGGSCKLNSSLENIDSCAEISKDCPLPDYVKPKTKRSCDNCRKQNKCMELNKRTFENPCMFWGEK